MRASGSRRRCAGAVLGALGLMLVGDLIADGGSPGQDPAGGLVQILGAPPQGFASAKAPRPFQFPEDHGPHREFRSEWWYYTGNVATDGGRRFAFQLTFFRFALSPQSSPASRCSSCPRVARYCCW